MKMTQLKSVITTQKKLPMKHHRSFVVTFLLLYMTLSVFSSPHSE